MDDYGRTEVFYRSTTPYSYAFVSTVQAYNVRAIAVSYGNNHTFRVYGDGGVEGLHFWASSDKNLKEDIVKLDKSLEKLLKLEGVSYKFIKKEVTLENVDDNTTTEEKPSETTEETYINEATKEKKDKEADRKELGLIAQEVEAIFPEAVRTSSEGTMMINYDALIPVLIEAIKEQNVEIENLKSSLDNSFKSADDESLLESVGAIALYQNKPNPFNEQTTIDFFLPNDIQTANLYIYDLTGKQIKSINVVQRENGSIIIYANELQSGMYKYALVADGNIVGTETMILTD